MHTQHVTNLIRRVNYQLGLPKNKHILEGDIKAYMLNEGEEEYFFSRAHDRSKNYFQYGVKRKPEECSLTKSAQETEKH